MRTLLRRLQSFHTPPSSLTTRLIEELGEDALRALVAEHVLVPRVPLAFYPCPNLGDQCPRVVERAKDDDERPYRAVSPQPGWCCDTLALSEEEVHGHVFDLAGFVRVLRRLFHVQGKANLTEHAFDFAFRIGEQLSPRREVYFCTNLSRTHGAAGLNVLLLERRPTLALVHAMHEHIPDWVFACRLPGLPVEVMFLDEVLVADSGGIRLVGSSAGSATAGLRDNVASFESPSRLLLSHEGRRELGEAEYQALASRHAEFALFIDATHGVESGRIFASRINADGQLEVCPLTTLQAAALIELVERRRPLRPAEMVSMRGISAPGKQVETARRRVDVTPRRYVWRAFQTIRGQGRLGKSFVFGPPDELTYAVIRSLDLD